MHTASARRLRDMRRKGVRQAGLALAMFGVGFRATGASNPTGQPLCFDGTAASLCGASIDGEKTAYRTTGCHPHIRHHWQRSGFDCSQPSPLRDVREPAAGNAASPKHYTSVPAASALDTTAGIGAGDRVASADFRCVGTVGMADCSGAIGGIGCGKRLNTQRTTCFYLTSVFISKNN